MQSGPVEKMGNRRLDERFLIGLIAGDHDDDDSHDENSDDNYGNGHHAHNWLESVL